VSIRSFLVYLRPGAREGVVAALGREPVCQVYPAENADLLVVVSEHTSPVEEAAFDERLRSTDGVSAVALVAGYRDDSEGEEGHP